MDTSNGYEAIADIYIKTRGQAIDGIGSSTIRAWAHALDKGAVVLDLGCGTGIPVTKILLEEGLAPYGLDASPRMIAAFRENFPEVASACEPVETSSFFDRTFDGIIAVGLIFLLHEDAQQAIIAKMAAALSPGGRLLFTAPSQKVEWKDIMTGQMSRSLGAQEYQHLMTAAGLCLTSEMEDEGGNHYFQAIR